MSPHRPSRRRPFTSLHFCKMNCEMPNESEAAATRDLMNISAIADRRDANSRVHGVGIDEESGVAGEEALALMVVSGIADLSAG